MRKPCKIGQNSLSEAMAFPKGYNGSSPLLAEIDPIHIFYGDCATIAD